MPLENGAVMRYIKQKEVPKMFDPNEHDVWLYDEPDYQEPYDDPYLDPEYPEYAEPLIECRYRGYLIGDGEYCACRDADFCEG